MRDQLVPDLEIAAIAGRQGGVIAHRQLRELGLSGTAIHRRIQVGRLHVLYRGVYAVGHPIVGVVGRRWAAVLACGEGAVLSHASAGSAWGLVRWNGVMHVTVARGGRSRRRGLRVHTTRVWRSDETTTLEGLPITTPQRTLLDLAAAGVGRAQLEAALHHAEQALRMDWGNLARLLERHAGRPGVPLLDATLARYAPADTRSELERIVLRLCDDHGIPRPQVNVVIEGRVRDFYWPHAGLVVEADSYTWHHSPTALNDDRERDVELTLAGVRFLRFTYEQCTERAGYVRRAILAGLRTQRRRAGAGRP